MDPKIHFDTNWKLIRVSVIDYEPNGTLTVLHVMNNLTEA